MTLTKKSGKLKVGTNTKTNIMSETTTLQTETQTQLLEIFLTFLTLETKNLMISFRETEFVNKLDSSIAYGKVVSSTKKDFRCGLGDAKAITDCLIWEIK